MKKILEDYDMKRVAIVVGITIVLAIALLYLLIGKPTGEYLPVNTKYANQSVTGDFVIPLIELTEGRVERVLADSDFTMRDVKNKVDATFVVRGGVNGTVFYNAAYFDIKEDIAIGINKKMHPENKFIETFILWDIPNGKPTAYIYVDEDWKRYIGDAWILYGPNFEKSKKFEWTPVAKGIYMNVLEDDWTRFKSADMETRAGGIMLTNMPTKEEIIASEKKAIVIVLI